MVSAPVWGTGGRGFKSRLPDHGIVSRVAHHHADTDADAVSVLVVGGGIAGVACAKELAKHGADVTIVDKHNYSQFQPLLYQVATAQLDTTDVARPLRSVFRKHGNVDVKLGEVTAIDPAARRVSCADGSSYAADYLVLAMGSQPQFFGTPGAAGHAFPLYSLADAERLRSRVFAAFEDADANPEHIGAGALDFVVVGGGCTGVETAGAIAELIGEVLPGSFHDLSLESAKVHIVDPGETLLRPFSDKAHAYVAKVFDRLGVEVHLGRHVTEVRADGVGLSDGSSIPSRTVIWAGGIEAAGAAAATGLAVGKGGRLDVTPDLTIAGHPRVYALGDVANTPGPDGNAYPQLGSVALQAGKWAARNIVAAASGGSPSPFEYHDKGIMAMIGRNAAVAEMGAHRHELHGSVAFAAWLGVHAWLMSGTRERIDAFVSWGWDYFSSNRADSVIDRPDAARIDWDDETAD